ncbi:MAG TPA: hypothetical protein VF974_08200 [Patescibacteria group bacterium]
MSNKSPDMNSKGVKVNTSEPLSPQGPLKDTLKAYDEWDINKLKDPTSYGDKNTKGQGSKP